MKTIQLVNIKGETIEFPANATIKDLVAAGVRTIEQAANEGITQT